MKPQVSPCTVLVRARFSAPCTIRETPGQPVHGPCALDMSYKGGKYRHDEPTRMAPPNRRRGHPAVMGSVEVTHTRSRHD